MELLHNFEVPVPIDTAWDALLDLERVAPCMPGASLTSLDGDDFTGQVKMKLGPVLLNYQGQGKVIDRDSANHVLSFEGKAQDTRGNGGASAKVRAQLSALTAHSTTVQLSTTLDVTGRPAQFGRGLMQEVSNKIVNQFAESLGHELIRPAGVATAHVDRSPGSTFAGPPPQVKDTLSLGSLVPTPVKVGAIVVGFYVAWKLGSARRP